MNDHRLYTPEDALARFEKFKEKIEKELEIEAVQKRVVAKITKSTTRIFDLNFFKHEEDESNFEEIFEEDEVPSVESSVQEEKEKVKKVKCGYVDDMAELSSDFQEEDDEAGSDNVDDFIADSATVDENVIRIDGEETKAEEEEEMRRLKRKFCTKRIIANPDTEQMVFEESESDIEIKELDVNEFEAQAKVFPKPKVAEKVQETLQRAFAPFEGDEERMFEENDEALRRLKRGDIKIDEMPKPQK